MDLQEEELAVDVAESELILESDTDFNLVNEEETEQVVEEIVPTQVIMSRHAQTSHQQFLWLMKYLLIFT